MNKVIAQINYRHDVWYAGPDFIHMFMRPVNDNAEMLLVFGCSRGVFCNFSVDYSFYTEELAELHAIIQAIRWERDNGQ